MNGLDPDGLLLAGTVLKLPAGAPAPARASEPAPAATVVPAAAPEPTPTRVGAADIQSVAAADGVSPSLAAAIAWQESGFNNGMVSAANARGVMQVMPGTWTTCSRTSPAAGSTRPRRRDNVTRRRALPQAPARSRPAATRAPRSPATTRASARSASRGMFDDTQQYVANVQALRSRFGG